MQFNRSHDYIPLVSGGSGTKEAIFVAVENGSTSAISAGYLCAYDTTDNHAVAGILANTYGLRVVIYPTAEEGAATDGLCRQAGIAHTDIPAGVAGARNGIYLMQVWGPRDDLKANTDANTNILKGGAIVPSGDAAGTLEGLSTETTWTVDTLSKTVGFSFEVVAVNTTTDFTGFVKCM
jgi:hypothetical protein